jgi:ACS family tartrate transporter-like MFS transporter
VGSVLGDVRVWLVGFFFLFTLGSSYAFSFSGPVIFAAVTGWSAGRVGFLLAAMSLVGAAAMQVVAVIADRQGKRLPWIVGLSVVMAVGFGVSGVAHSPWIVVPAVSIAMVSFYGLEAPALSLITTFWRDRRRRSGLRR